MKTLNLSLRTILLTFILVSTTTTAFAYDMYVNGVYYNINGDKATVTYQSTYTSGGSTYYESSYSGHVTIPETVTYNGLTYTVTGIGSYAFYNRNSSTDLRSISIPNTVKTIGSSSFYNCSGLSSVAIPISVTSIGGDAFSYCSGLTSLTIPDSVTSIGTNAFYRCINMTNVTIGSSVTSIGRNAFYGTPLSYITCLAETPPTLNSSYSYFNSYVNTTLYVPSNSIQAYRTASIWSNFKIITDYKPNFFSLDDVSVMHGDTIVVPVMMENENDITAFQTDICLVNGFEFVKNENDEYQVSLSDRKGRDHVIMASETPDGTVRIASYSPTLKAYKNNEGELFYITVKAPENGAGVYPIILKNTRLTTVDEDEVLSPDVFCNVTVIPYIKGDANNSGDVTVSDVVVTAKYILFQNPVPFNLEAADMNGDGKITITDVVKIANLILDQDYDDPENMRMMAPNMVGDHMSANANGNAVSISLDNEMEYTAFQLDLILPEGMTASDFYLSERANELDLVVKDKGNGRIRLMGYTPTLKTIQGHEGSLLTFKATGGNDIVVDHIELVTPEGETVHPNAFTIPMNQQITAVKELADSKAVDHIDYYNLAGQRVDSPEKGVTLVVTTYQDGTRNTSKIIR